MCDISYNSEIIMLEDEIESIELQIKSLELDLIKKKKHLKKRIDGKFASIFINDIAELESKHQENDKNDYNYSENDKTNMLNVLNSIFDMGECECIRISKDKNLIYVNLNSIWKDINSEKEYNSRMFIRSLKKYNIVTGGCDDYYRSTRIGSKLSKCYVMNYQIIREILKEA